MCLHSHQRLLTLLDGVPCPSCRVGDARVTGPPVRVNGGTSIIYRQCSQCNWQEAHHTGQRIKTAVGKHCGAPTLEAIRLMLAMFCTGDLLFASYQRVLAACTLKPVSSYQFSNFSSWLRPFVAEALVTALQRARDIVAKRPSGQIGSWSKLVVLSDCFWSKRSKRNHAGDSSAGCVPLLDQPSSLILAVCMVNRLGDKKVPVEVIL
jgi:hypothetical protein